MKQPKLNQQKQKKGSSEIRKLFYKRLIYIGLCAVPLWILANEKPPLSYLALLFFLIGMINFLAIVQLSQFIVDDFFPPKTYFEKTTQPFDHFMYYFATGLFFVSIVFQIFEIRTIDNTLHGMKLFWSAGGFGIVIAIILTVILKKIQPSVYFESKRRYTVHFGLFVGLFLTVSATASFVNHNFADNKEICNEYKIVRKSQSGGKNRSSFIFVNIDNLSEERFDISRAFYNKINEGQIINIYTIKGKLGFEFVTNFKTIN